MAGRSLRMGCDIGGTFTDFVLIDESDGSIHTYKTLTTPSDPSYAVTTGVTALLESVLATAEELAIIIHGTTLITNALIERKGAMTALIVTDGFRDILEMGTEMRYDIYDLFMQRPEPLVSRECSYELRERLDRTGAVRREIDTDQLEEIGAHLSTQGVEALAICLLHSFRNAAHEQQVRDALVTSLPGVAISLSSEVAPEIREYERASTTVANAYVQPLAERYLAQLLNALTALGHTKPLYLMLSSGGIATAETAIRFPIRLVESGPAAGALAAAYYGQQIATGDILSFDMGGTTAKACLITGNTPAKASSFEIARVHRFKRGSGLPVRIPAMELIEIGAGGGSIAWLDELGLLKVGPRSAGADPGPACYGRGGADATVTDANLLLGYLNPDYFLGGRMRLSVDGAREAIVRHVAAPLGLTAGQAASGIFRIVNENMVAATKTHAAERGADPRRFTLIAFGGAGPMHAYELARALKLPRIVIPLAAGATSALGFLVAPVSFDFARSLVSRLDRIDFEQLRAAFAQMAAEGRELLRQAGVGAEQIMTIYSADMRHKGQGRELTVQIGDPETLDADTLARLFHARYRAIYGHAHEHLPVELMTCRLTVSGPVPEVSLLRIGRTTDRWDAARKGYRSAFFPECDQYLPTPVYDRYQLALGVTCPGPAIIEERESTAVVGPSAEITTDQFNNLVITLRTREEITG